MRDDRDKPAWNRSGTRHPSFGVHSGTGRDESLDFWAMRADGHRLRRIRQRTRTLAVESGGWPAVRACISIACATRRDMWAASTERATGRRITGWPPKASTPADRVGNARRRGRARGSSGQDLRDLLAGRLSGADPQDRLPALGDGGEPAAVHAGDLADGGKPVPGVAGGRRSRYRRPECRLARLNIN